MSIKEQGWYLKQKQERLEQEIESLRSMIKDQHQFKQKQMEHIKELEQERDEWKRRAELMKEWQYTNGFTEKANLWQKFLLDCPEAKDWFKEE